MLSDWEDIASLVPVQSAQDFLVSKGLGNYVQKIIGVTDAESLEDLKLLDAAMVEEVIQKAELKMISAKKFRVAISEIRGEAASSSASPKGLQSSGYHTGATTKPEEPPVVVEVKPQEVIAVCIDRSGSMGTPFTEVTLNEVKGAVAERTRMEAVKAMFYAFRDRVENVGKGSHQIGLLQFDDKVETLLDATPRLELFEAIVDDMERRGMTAIYSAVTEAASMLEKTFLKDPQVDLRVLVLTDGQSNIGVTPASALEAVNSIGAVVDAIIVGNSPDANLRKIVTATGGECYQIGSLGEGFELLESEGVVSLKARRGGTEKKTFKRPEMIDFTSIVEKTMTRGTAVQRAPVLAPDFAKKKVVNLASMDQSSVPVPSGANGASMKRLMMELKQVASGTEKVWMHSGEGIHVFPSPDAINFWRVLIEGPSGSPFEGGVFALNAIMPSDYPFSAPKITFETPVYHCNVSDSGNICLNILQDKWCPSLTVPKCLEAIRIMLKEPDTDDSLRQWIAELTLAYKKSNGADTRYIDKASECTRKDASMSVVDWKVNWGC
jgi:ubiquitin-protein ligase/Mg-chelatase subunit ChlD